MATPKELVAAVANEMGVPEATVIVHDRNLAAAGLRTPASRGRGTSHVTYADVSNLLIAVAGSRNVKDSVKTVQVYAGLLADELMTFHDGTIRGRTFADALAALLDIVPAAREAFAGPNADWVNVSLHGPEPRAVIEIGKAGKDPTLYTYERPRRRGEHSPFADLKFTATFSQVTLGIVGQLADSA